MTAAQWMLVLSSVFLAIPALRAILRIWRARRKQRQAESKEESLSELLDQDKEATKLEVANLKAQANDLIEFNALIPNWAIWLTLAGIVLNVLARLAPIVVSG